MSPRRDLASRHPLLYHVAEDGALAGIQRHGLLSTTALLDRFEYDGISRDAIESEWRSESIRISHPSHGIAVVRDQKPMRPAWLQRCLRDGLTPRDWYRMMNGKVFLWPRAGGVAALLSATQYRDRPHLVLTLDTASLLGDGAHTVAVSAINSGNARRRPAPRGLDTFVPVGSAALPSRIVEVAVEYAIPDVMAHVIAAERRQNGRVVDRLVL